MLLPLAILLCLTLASAQIFNPGQRREVWRVGETKTVRYNTKQKNYTIALWQQAMQGNFAERGPIIFETTQGPQKEFTWKVDLGKLELGASDVYFLWFFEGGPSNQGRTREGLEEWSSAYFNITDKPAPRSSSQTTSTSTSKLTSSLTLPLITLPSLSSSSTNTDTTTTTSTAESSSVTTASTTAGGSFDGDKPLRPEDFALGSSKSLPVAAQAGIGVGVGVIGATCIICVVLWVRYLKKKRVAVAELPGGPLVQSPPAYVRDVPEAVQLSDRKDTGYYVNKKPVEIQ
ncbi:hypothetical protein CPLU01_12477 [Colletotrichum plurivorum]|uniref:Mid2 domain-containing protein n=1 Tax=Colletotrichum plurivorum TaxID=2175906 RepID=A0A8H6N5T1_9PEZI|nr:hypothetical protein CPLU01_12477 [Colletotrichum plurivorum]